MFITFPADEKTKARLDAVCKSLGITFEEWFETALIESEYDVISAIKYTLHIGNGNDEDKDVEQPSMEQIRAAIKAITHTRGSFVVLKPSEPIQGSIYMQTALPIEGYDDGLGFLVEIRIEATRTFTHYQYRTKDSDFVCHLFRDYYIHQILPDLTRWEDITDDFLKDGIKKIELKYYAYGKKSITLEESELAVTLGHALETGLLLPQNYEDAVHLYYLAARAKNPVAYNNLAWMYLNGYGVKKDISEAAKWFLKAAKSGVSLAMVNLGNIYEFGIGMAEPDYKKAVTWYKKAADIGSLKGQFNYANMLHHGHGIQQDRKRAFEIFLELADLNNRDCYFYLGLYYQEGYVVETNYEKARQYYLEGAAGKDIYCLHQLGVLYGKGLGVEQDITKALKYYRKAASGGNKLSNTCIGWCYENGEGVKRNLKTALKWYEEASESGEENALKALTRLNYFAPETFLYEEKQGDLESFLKASIRRGCLEFYGKDLTELRNSLSVDFEDEWSYLFSRKETEKLYNALKEADEPLMELIVANFSGSEGTEKLREFCESQCITYKVSSN